LHEKIAGLFGLLTTQANKTVGAIHPQAMPVILSSAEEIDVWMHASGRGCHAAKAAPGRHAADCGSGREAGWVETQLGSVAHPWYLGRCQKGYGLVK